MSHLRHLIDSKILKEAKYIDRKVDLYEITKRMGIHIIDQECTTFILGPEKHPTIVLDTRLSELEKRVALAHEIVHCAAHVGNQLFISSALSKQQEEQSNLMAYYLLIPTELLKGDLEGQSFKDGEEAAAFIANQYGVPIPFARDRLRQFHFETYDDCLRFGRDYDTVWEHPGTKKKVYFKNGKLVKKDCSYE